MRIQTTVLPGRDRLALCGLPTERINLLIDYETIYCDDRKSMPGAVAFPLDKNGTCKTASDFIYWKNRRRSGVRLHGDSLSYREEFAIYPHYLKKHVKQVIFCFTGSQSLWPEQSMADIHFVKLWATPLQGEQRLLADYRLPDLGSTSAMQIAILSKSRSGWTLSAEPLPLKGSLEDVCRLFKALPKAN